MSSRSGGRRMTMVIKAATIVEQLIGVVRKDLSKIVLRRLTQR